MQISLKMHSLDASILVVIDVVVAACLSGCRWLLTSRVAGLLIRGGGGGIIEGARLQL